MGDFLDEKSKDNLPIYAPLPEEEDHIALIDAAHKRQSRRCRAFIRHAAVLFVTGLFLYYALKKGGKCIKKIAYHKYSDADYFAENNVFGDEGHRPRLSECHKWSNESSAEDSTFTYSFPVNSSALHFTARGHFVGKVNYVLANSSDSGDFISVSVTLGAADIYTGGPSVFGEHSFWAKLRQSWPRKRRHPKNPRAKVCILSNEHEPEVPSGLAILTPPRRRGGRWRWFRRPAPPMHPVPPRAPDFPARPIPPVHPGVPCRPGMPHAPHPHPHPPPPPENLPFWGFDDLHHSIGEREYEGEHEKRGGHNHHPHHHHHHHHHHHLHDGETSHEPLVPVVDVKVTITIPHGALQLPTLHSVFPGLAQHIGDVFDGVTFGRVTLVGKDVAVDTITSSKAVLVTGGGQPIKGSFNVSESLSIVARASPIIVNVTMFSSPSSGEPTVLDIVNNNAPIFSTISLLLNPTANEARIHNGFFAISQVTSQAAINSIVTSQPLDSTVRFTAISKNADVAAAFPPAYQGRFSLVANRHGKSILKADPDVKDPSGEGRERYIEERDIFGHIVTGFVGWRGGNETEEYLLIKHLLELDEDEATSPLADIWESEGAAPLAQDGSPPPPPPPFEYPEETGEYTPSISLVTSTGTNRLYFV